MVVPDESFRSFAEATFPRLSGTAFEKTSPATREYNCIAWAAGEDDRWWEPIPSGAGYYWPQGARRGTDIGALVEAYEAIGYVKCEDGTIEDGYEKIALFASSDGEWTHASRQLGSGRWSSKLGEEADIEHEAPGDLAGSQYGGVYCYMARAEE